MCFSVVIVVFLFPLVHCEYFFNKDFEEIESDLSVIGSREELNMSLSWREAETCFFRNWNRTIVCSSVIIVVFFPRY